MKFLTNLCFSKVMILDSFLLRKTEAVATVAIQRPGLLLVSAPITAHQSLVREKLLQLFKIPKICFPRGSSQE